MLLLTRLVQIPIRRAKEKAMPRKRDQVSGSSGAVKSMDEARSQSEFEFASTQETDIKPQVVCTEPETLGQSLFFDERQGPKLCIIALRV